MTDLEALDAAIQSFAVAGRAKVQIGNTSVETKSLQELLDWRKQLLNDQAATRPGAGMRFQKITPSYP
jgi:hypothetical protein